MTTIISFISILWLPAFVLSVACIVIARALDEPDEISAIVRVLINTDRLMKGGASISAPVSSWAETVMGLLSQRPARAVLLLPLSLAPASPAYAARFEFDQRRTEVRFVYKMAYSTQRGRFTSVSGALDYDEKTPERSKITASIKTASLTTGEALVDAELKGAAFFNVETSPIIVFKSLAVKPHSTATAEVAGEITVNGITKPVTLDVSLKPHDDPALKHDEGARQFIATTRIKRSAFNMTAYQSMVDDDIDIEIDAIVRPR